MACKHRGPHLCLKLVVSCAPGRTLWQRIRVHLYAQVIRWAAYRLCMVAPIYKLAFEPEEEIDGGGKINVREVYGTAHHPQGRWRI